MKIYGCAKIAIRLHLNYTLELFSLSSRHESRSKVKVIHGLISAGHKPEHVKVKVIIQGLISAGLKPEHVKVKVVQGLISADLKVKVIQGLILDGQI